MTHPADFQQARADVEKAQKTLTPEEVKAHERNLLLGVFDAWPEVVAGLCNALNELLKEQVVIAQALDPAPLRVKAVRPDTLRAAVEADGTDALVEVLTRVETSNREILRRAKVVRAERDRLAAALQGGERGGPTE